MENSKDQSPLHSDMPNPSEYMRARHPDLFSDTKVDTVFKLSKATFEYHLDTLTSRKQEYEFEHFCRKLAEKEICPNLRVQTGPTGGGDSKVDTETYPVAEEIFERYWIGSPAAGSERWAFAFSAKKEWKSKVKGDVNSIISTDRNYKLIYFFTNQFVSDKKRADAEDELSIHAKIPVHIIDRAWLVEKVYENDHLDIAIETLSIEGTQNETVSRSGPRDTERLSELEELDKQVADPSCYQGIRYQLVEDCLRTAMLARGLEQPRNEVESRFAQAYRLAQDVNYRPQLLRIAYNRAWTAYWWYEDYSAFNQFYKDVEQHTNGSNQASEVELLINLWMLLIPSVGTGNITVQEANIDSRQQCISAMLKPLAADPARLNNALRARTSLAFLEITQDFQANLFDQMDIGFQKIMQVVKESATLGDFPMEQLYNRLTAIGEMVDTHTFDALFEQVADALRNLQSDGEAGEAYTKRGMQKLRLDKPYEAIQWFGRAEGLLFKHEHHAELILALIGGSYGYEKVGLLWAARNKVLAAVERSLALFEKHKEMQPPVLNTIKRLVWVELQLGRIPHIINAMTLVSSVASYSKLSEKEQDSFNKELLIQEGILVIHLLNIPFETLPDVTRLPDSLDRVGLTNAWMALLFVLGHEEALRDYGPIIGETPIAVQAFFESWHDQPAVNDLLPQPLLANGATSILKSTILGTEIIVETHNNATSFCIAESLLGVLEAFLATSEEQDAMPFRERLKIVIKPADQKASGIQLRFTENDDSAEIRHPAELVFETNTDRKKYMDWLHDSLIQIIPRILMIKDLDAWLKKVAGQEQGFARALTHSDTFTLNKNVFGETNKLLLADWLEPEDKSWPILRKEHWRASKTSDYANNGEMKEPPQFGNGPPPTELFDKSKLKHTDRRVFSPIDTLLWDRAKWQGVSFAYYKNVAPVLGVMFGEEEIGKAIFQDWQTRWKGGDDNDELRLAIILGLSKINPAEYAVVVGPNLDRISSSDKKLTILVSRINRMTPSSTTNMDTFIRAYKKSGTFLLAPAWAGLSQPIPFMELAIIKRHLHIRNAWELGENDMDISVLKDDDDPIIPEGIENPPVNKALEQIRAL